MISLTTNPLFTKILVGKYKPVRKYQILEIVKDIQTLESKVEILKSIINEQEKEIQLLMDVKELGVKIRKSVDNRYEEINSFMSRYPCRSYTYTLTSFQFQIDL